MKFGVLEHTKDVDFTFPPVNIANPISGERKTNSIQFYFGGPVWGDKNYLGNIFPLKTKQKDFLKVYSSQFNSIEVNATRYGTPKIETITHWRDQVPDGFKFSMKIPQVVTHRKDINDDMARFKLDEFLVALDSLGNKNGVAFGVMANYLRPDNFRGLQQFVKSLPQDMQFALELRAPEWFADAVILQEWQHLFAENNIIPVLTDTPGRRDVLHFCVINNHFFARYVGRYDDKSEAFRITQWVNRIEEFIIKGVNTFWFYVHEGDNRAFTLYFFNDLIAQLNHRLKCEIPLLKDYSTSSLFV
jgi:uncharacterized protein YecE (DUF72 family)